MQFDPPDGYRNIARFPTTPASEADFRDSMQSLLDQLRDEMNKGGSSAIGIQALARQAIINGNFDIWQRGTNFTNPGINSYTADRFSVIDVPDSGTNPTITHSRQQLNPGELVGADYCYRISTDGAGLNYGTNAQEAIQQSIENGVKFLCGAGKKITVSFWARSSINNKKLGVYAQQYYGTGGNPSSFDSLNGTYKLLSPEWQRYTVTFDASDITSRSFGTNNNSSLIIRFYTAWGINTSDLVGDTVAEGWGGAVDIDIAQVQVCAGYEALPFQPKSFAEELSLCQRYYEKSYVYGDKPGTVVNNGAFFGATVDNTNTGVHRGVVPFLVKKRIIPSVTIYGVAGTPSQVYDGNADRPVSSGAVISFVSESNFRFDYTVSGATTPSRAFHYTLDAEL